MNSYLRIKLCGYPALQSRRVVVTGLGMVTCLGVGVKTNWTKILLPKSGIRKLPEDKFSKLPSCIGGLVPEEELQPFTKCFGSMKPLSRISLFALIAAEEALKQANWMPENDEQKNNTGVVLGVGMGSADDFLKASLAYRERGYRRVDPYALVRVLPNISASVVTTQWGFGGPCRTINTACASGLNAIGDAARMIQYGDADVMIAGGTESVVLPEIFALFIQTRALATAFNERPEESSRPFDKDRNGFVMSEGSGVVILEELEHALARGATPLAEIIGYGSSADAHSLFAPHPSGEGVYRAMRKALNQAGVKASQLSFIDTHATSTPAGDEAECQSIYKLIKNSSDSPTPAVYSAKGHLGHLLAGAGAVESILAIEALRNGRIPFTCNLKEPSVGKFTDLNFVLPSESGGRLDPNRNLDRRFALTNSFGMGGVNSSLCLASDIVV